MLQVFLAKTVVGAIPPKAKYALLTMLLSGSKNTFNAILTIAISSSRLLACLKAIKY